MLNKTYSSENKTLLENILHGIRLGIQEVKGKCDYCGEVGELLLCDGYNCTVCCHSQCIPQVYNQSSTEGSSEMWLCNECEELLEKERLNRRYPEFNDKNYWNLHFYLKKNKEIISIIISDLKNQQSIRDLRIQESKRTDKYYMPHPQEVTVTEHLKDKIRELESTLEHIQTKKKTNFQPKPKDYQMIISISNDINMYNLVGSPALIVERKPLLSIAPSFESRKRPKPFPIDNNLLKRKKYYEGSSDEEEIINQRKKRKRKDEDLDTEFDVTKAEIIEESVTFVDYIEEDDDDSESSKSKRKMKQKSKIYKPRTKQELPFQPELIQKNSIPKKMENNIQRSDISLATSDRKNLSKPRSFEEPSILKSMNHSSSSIRKDDKFYHEHETKVKPNSKKEYNSHSQGKSSQSNLRTSFFPLSLGPRGEELIPKNLISSQGSKNSNTNVVKSLPSSQKQQTQNYQNHQNQVNNDGKQLNQKQILQNNVKKVNTSSSHNNSQQNSQIYTQQNAQHNSQQNVQINSQLNSQQNIAAHHNNRNVRNQSNQQSNPMLWVSSLDTMNPSQQHFQHLQQMSQLNQSNPQFQSRNLLPQELNSIPFGNNHGLDSNRLYYDSFFDWTTPSNTENDGHLWFYMNQIMGPNPNNQQNQQQSNDPNGEDIF